jgi:hypothetical protein
MGDRVVIRPLHQPVDRLDEDRPLLHVDPARKQRVTGEQQAGRPVVEHRGGRVVTRRRDHVHHPPAEVQLAGAARPIVETVELTDVRELVTNDRRVRPVEELTVRGTVVPVTMGVGDDQLVVGPPGFAHPSCDVLIDDRAQREVLRLWRGSGVDQQGTVPAEDQEHERRLEVRRHVLP